MVSVKQTKIGNSYYILVPKEFRDKELHLVTADDLNDENEIRDLLNVVKQLEANTSVEMLNRLDYLEHCIDKFKEPTVHNDYLNKEITLQEMYNELSKLTGTVYNMRKQIQ